MLCRGLTRSSLSGSVCFARNGRLFSAAASRPVTLGPTPIEYDKPRAVLLAVQIPTDTVLDREGPLLLSKIPGVVLRMQKCEFVSVRPRALVDPQDISTDHVSTTSADAQDAEEISADTYERAAGNIARAAALPLPSDEIDTVGLSCTSMSFVLGADRVDAQLRRAVPHAKTTDMARAQAGALAALGVERIALVTPYIVDLAEKNAAMLAECGVTVVAHHTMGLTHDSQTDKVSKPTIRAWAQAVDCESAQAIVIGCSAMRACEPGFIDEVEAAVGKPVVTSTQAFLWSMLRTSGINDQISGYGHLMSKC
jgi:maleate isomerase